MSSLFQEKSMRITGRNDARNVQTVDYIDATASDSLNVLRNTYMLLSMTLLFSALTAGLTIAYAIPGPGSILTLIGYFGLLFATTKLRNSAWGILSVFALTGFLMAGMIVVLVASLGAIFFQIPALSLTISAVMVLLMSGMILFETSNIINGGETNYIMATVNLYVTIFNLFISLLQLLGFVEKD